VPNRYCRAVPKRRARGEGSIYHDERRGRWVGQIDQFVDGGRRRIRVTGKSRAIVAKKMVDARIRLAETPTPVATRPDDPIDGSRPGPRASTAAWLRWWAREVMPRGVSPATADSYNKIVEMVDPYIGDIRLCDLRSHDVDRMMAEMLVTPGRRRKPVQASTVANRRTVLRRALNVLTRLGAPVAVPNPVSLTDRPKTGGHRLDDTLTEDQVETVAAALRGDRWEAVGLLGMYVGLRSGEIAALRWSDFDLVARTARVRKSKTKAGIRPVPLPRHVVDALRRHAETQAAEIADAPAWEDTTGLVFTRPFGIPVSHQNDFLKWWYGVCERAGIPRCRFHATRHTAATMMLNNGVPLEVVSKILGHSSYAVTADIYAKVGTEMYEDAARAMDDLYAKRAAARAG
jgi:integrase